MNAVSFIIPVFRSTEHIAKALNSVFSQSVQDFSVVVVNDSDTDIESALNSVLENYDTSRIKLIHTHNVGPTVARNIGICSTETPYYVPIDDDDSISPLYLEYTLPIIESDSALGFVYGNSIYCYDPHAQQVALTKSVPSPDYSFCDLLFSNYIVYCSLFRRDAYNDVGGYNPNNFGYFEDYEFTIKLGARGWYGYHIIKDLFYYRVKRDSLYHSDRTQKLEGVYKAYIITQHPKVFPLAWQKSALEIMATYPKNFMSVKPALQEEFIIERNL